MEETELVCTPLVISAVITPNPAEAGGSVFIQVAAVDAPGVESFEAKTSNEFTGGEV